MQWVETTTTVRFNEIDQWGIAWYGHYFSWFELGRMRVLEQFALLPRDFSAFGLIAPVVRASCDYKKSALTNDRIVIRTHLVKPQTTSLTFQFEVLRQAEGELLARGETMQVLTRLDGVMIYKLEGALKERVESMVCYFWPERESS
jgi:acyl-CoA thioester hydrolase